MKLCTACFVAIAATVFAGHVPPLRAATAVVTGPTGGVPGDILILDASDSTGEFFQWQIAEEFTDGRQAILPIEGGKRCIVSSRRGVYTVFLIVGDKDGVDSRRFRIVVSDAPDPGPTPPEPVPPNPGPTPPGPNPPVPPQPDPELGELAKAVFNAAVSIQDKERAKQFAENFAGIAAGIAAGAYPGEPRYEVGRVISDTYKLNTPIVTAYPKWDAFFKGVLRTELNRREAAGRYSTVKTLGEDFREIAKGLEEAAK